MNHKNKDSDIKKIKELIDIMKKNNLVEVEIKHGDDKIFLKSAQTNQPMVAAVPMMAANGVVPNNSAGNSANNTTVQGGAATEADDGLVKITSPIVGTFYATQSPDSDYFVEVGSHVEENTVVCIVEAMKVMNEIKAETTGTIVEVMLTNGQAVEFGQVLFKVKPD